MTKLFKKFGNVLVISRRHRHVRKSVIFLFTNLLVLAGLIFTLEIVLIFLGVGDIILPFQFFNGDFIKGLIF